MNKLWSVLGFAALTLFTSLGLVSCSRKEAQVYLTSTSREYLFEKVQPLKQPSAEAKIINLDPSQVFQVIDGFGAAVTGSVCYNLQQMEEADRKSFLRMVFDPDEGVGYSCIRISIGCSDFSLMEYTCCDKPGIENFALPELDRMDLLPVLHEILEINPKIKILASPWTCPKWMKVDNLTDLNPLDSWTSGQLNPAYYQDYATYFVRFIQEMRKEGFDIYALTIQNEPLNRGNSASLYMGWREQLVFIRDYLGPAFEKNGIGTKILAYDHNYNYDNIAEEQDYVMNLYNDKEALKYISGSAWHNYGGRVSELDHVYEAYPDKDIYFTECSIGKWSAKSKEECFEKDLMSNTRNVCIGTLNRGAKAVTVWNLLLDDEGAPNRPGGCRTCYGALEISHEDYKTLVGNSHYYSIAHFSKVIRPGAQRIASSMEGDSSKISFTAARNEDGSVGVVILNERNEDEEFTVLLGGKETSVLVPSMAVASLLIP